MDLYETRVYSVFIGIHTDSFLRFYGTLEQTYKLTPSPRVPGEE